MEQGFAFLQHQLSKHAPQRPHIDSCGIVPHSKKQLRRSKPQRHHLSSIHELLIVRNNIPGQAKISYLNLSLIRHQNIGTFDISVDYVLAMQVLQPFQYLLDDAFDVRQLKLQFCIVHESL